MKAYIYKITSPSGRIYIGSTLNFERRKKEYQKGKLISQHKVRASLNKYGFDKHIIEIINECDEKERFKKEYEYGILFNVLDKYLGLNLKLPKVEDSISYSEETLQKMRLARKGKSAYWNNKGISLYDLEGNYIKTYNSQIDCSKELGCKRELVVNIIAGHINTFKNIYQLKKGYSKENIGKPKDRKIRTDKGKHNLLNRKKIKCVEDSTIFDSVSEAANYYNLLITSISNNLYGRSKKTRNGKSFCYI